MDLTPRSLVSTPRVTVKDLMGVGKGFSLMNDLDSVIVAEYVPFGTPADTIVADPEVSEEFTQRSIPTCPLSAGSTPLQ